MRFMSSLIVVKDMEKSKKFYQEVLGSRIIQDFGENVTFLGEFALQTEETWLDFIEKPENVLKYKSNTTELYFEEGNFDKFIKHLKSFNNIKYVHEVKEHEWGQRGVRFYDPDGHIIEVGETLRNVCKRFLAQGLSIEETSKKSMMPMEFVKSCLPKNKK